MVEAFSFNCHLCIFLLVTLVASSLPTPGLQGRWPGLHEDVALDEGFAHLHVGWSRLGFR